MLQELLDKQKESIDLFFNDFDQAVAEQVLQTFLDCKGWIFFTGVGKSGIIAKKIAMTIVSTGTRALYISPVNALHGDLGIVSKDDVFVLISKGGESQELMDLVPSLRNKGAKVISWVSNPKSRLAKAADLFLHIPMKEELCPYGLAPTTSPAIQLLVGDMIAVALMKKKKFSLDQYAENHPAGQIGKRVTMKVRDLMLAGEEVPRAKPGDRLGDKLVELTDKRCGCLVIVDENDKLQGIFTDGDLRRALQSKQDRILETRLDTLMTKVPKSIESSRLAWDAAKEMESDQKRPVMVLPVVEEEKVVGLIKMHDILQSGL